VHAQHLGRHADEKQVLIESHTNNPKSWSRINALADTIRV